MAEIKQTTKEERDMAEDIIRRMAAECGEENADVYFGKNVWFAVGSRGEIVRENLNEAYLEALSEIN